MVQTNTKRQFWWYAHWFLLYSQVILQLSSAIVDFYLFYDGAVDMLIWALLTKNQCTVSGTQVTFKAHGPLVETFVISPNDPSQNTFNIYHNILYCSLLKAGQLKMIQVSTVSSYSVWNVLWRRMGILIFWLRKTWARQATDYGCVGFLWTNTHRNTEWFFVYWIDITDNR